jgi:hypothetical protein
MCCSKKGMHVIFKSGRRRKMQAKSERYPKGAMTCVWRSFDVVL